MRVATITPKSLFSQLDILDNRSVYNPSNRFSNTNRKTKME